MTLRLTHTAKTYPDGTKALAAHRTLRRKGRDRLASWAIRLRKNHVVAHHRGLETPDAGSDIWFDDDNVTALPVERAKLGWCFNPTPCSRTCPCAPTLVMG